MYQTEFERLKIENQTYSLPCGDKVVPKWFQNGSNLEPQIRLDKNREDKNREDILSTDVDARPRFDYQSVIDCFNFVNQMATKCQPNDNQMPAQNKINKSKVNKNKVVRFVRFAYDIIKLEKMTTRYCISVILL